MAEFSGDLLLDGELGRVKNILSFQCLDKKKTLNVLMHVSPRELNIFLLNSFNKLSINTEFIVQFYPNDTYKLAENSEDLVHNYYFLVETNRIRTLKPILFFVNSTNIK